MYDRIAWIWFSCFCWASENFRSNPFALVSVSWMSLVLAARQPLSEPTCEKPTVMSLLPEPAAAPDVVVPVLPPLLQAARAMSAVAARAPTTLIRFCLLWDMGLLLEMHDRHRCRHRPRVGESAESGPHRPRRKR